MPRTPQHLLALLLLLATAAAQTPAPASPPQTSAQPPAAPTIQTRTNLVIEDVVVTDRRGNPISGLKASDFALTEKGAPQQIRTFDEHTAQPPAPATPPLDLPPGVFTNYNPIPPSPALNVLLLDTLNTPLQDQAYLRLQLLKYIRTAPPNQRLAIFGLTTHLILLQGFTADPAILRAAIDRKSLRASQLLDNPTTGAPNEQTSDTLNDIAAAAGPQQGAAIAQTAAIFRQFEAETGIFQLQLRARYTLEALGALARYLAVLPGRKNILWFSGSFPLSVFPDTSLSDPFRATADLSSDLRNTANILTRAQVAVYPSTPAASSPIPPSTPPTVAAISFVPVAPPPRNSASASRPPPSRPPCVSLPSRPAAAPSSTPTASPKPSPTPSTTARTSTPSPTPPPTPASTTPSAPSA